MRDTTEIYEQIDRYLSNSMESNELNEFQNQVNSNSELFELVEMQKAANEIIVGNRLAGLKQMMDADFAQMDEGKPSKLKYWLGGAFIATVIVGTIMYNDKNEKEVTKIVAPVSNQTVIVEKAEVEKTENQVVAKSKIQTSTASKSDIAIVEVKPKIAQVDVVSPVLQTPTVQSNIVVERPKVVDSEVAKKHTVEKIHSEDLSPKHEVSETKSNNSTSPEVKNVKHKAQSINLDLGEQFTFPTIIENEAQASIYNRGGMLVYKTKLVQDQTEVWTGTDSNGTVVQSGLYIYIIEYISGSKSTGEIVVY